ncbi:hypothetical protein LCGC14_2159190 [marine sediment metagenome]|uniref:NUMOD4 domain-containing protein n=1 Tax=marine sediment metagenome TaxID=412755 RepID=A0A0F9G658_9ZZZZ
MSEVLWKPIPGFEVRYSASTDGQIKSEARVIKKITGPAKLKEKLRKSVLGDDGYYRIVLRKDNKSHGFLLHRLILSAIDITIFYLHLFKIFKSIFNFSNDEFTHS